MTVYIGIDPGVSGAIAYMWDGVAQVVSTPTLKAGKAGKDYNRQSMKEMLGAISRGRDAQAVIERQQFRPADGKGQVFKTGYGFGVWMGLMADLPVEVVSPQKWKKFFGLDKGKDASLRKALDLFPEQDIGKNHNKAEALLLMEYARRLFT